MYTILQISHLHSSVLFTFPLKLYSPFLWMGYSCLKATEPLQGGSLFFTIKFLEIPGTHLIDLGRMKG